MFGRNRNKFPGASLREQYQSIIKEIETGASITPRHAQPASIDQDGGRLITNSDRDAFAKTRSSGLIINQYLDHSAWRIQEKNTCFLAQWSEDPLFGRTF